MKYPFLTPTDVEAVIADYSYHRFEGTTTTVCCVILKNGFTVIGQSGCLNPENFDASLGEHYARKDALNKIWPLLGYNLLDKLQVTA